MTFEHQLVEYLDESELGQPIRRAVERADPGQDELVGRRIASGSAVRTLSAPILRSMFWTDPRLPIPWSTTTIMAVRLLS